MDTSQSGRGSIMEMGKQTREEASRIRTAVVQQEGILASLFDLLRRVPRRMLMVGSAGGSHCEALTKPNPLGPQSQVSGYSGLGRRD